MSEQSFPDRLEHPDFWLLATIVQEWEALLRRQDDEGERALTEIATSAVDEASMAHVGVQRALSISGVALGLAPPYQSRLQSIKDIASIYSEAVIVGIQFERRRQEAQARLGAVGIWG